MPDILLTADRSLILKVETDHGGKLRVQCSSWEDVRVILAGERLEIVSERGQIILRRAKDAEDNRNLNRPEVSAGALNQAPPHLGDPLGELQIPMPNPPPSGAAVVPTSAGGVAGLAITAPPLVPEGAPPSTTTGRIGR